MAVIFSRSADKYLRLTVLIALFGGAGAIGLIAYLSHPAVRDTGYAPAQPVEYSHKLHAGNLGLDCRYCHSTVERSAFAALPATEVCMNCHARVKKDSPLLQPVRDSFATGAPIPWVKVHRLPDYVYFNHRAHVTAGVSCASCHGRVDQMIVVKQTAPLSMAWCLDCHRNPDASVRPAEQVTNLGWQPDRDAAEIGREIIQAKGIAPPTNCSGCHR
ncbi:MAG: cytochrome c3 family protein [Bryobacteraceae bacterium]|nr:cytochrome c3 family protein [Bryobacteraceae bacterium]